MFARSLTNTTEFKAGVLFILISCISLLIDVILYGFQLSTKEFKESVRVLKILKIFCLLIERLSRYRWFHLLVQELQPHIVCARLAQLVRSLTANQEVPGSSSGLVEGWTFGDLLSPHRPWTGSLSRWSSLDVLSGDLKEPTHLSISVG